MCEDAKSTDRALTQRIDGGLLDGPSEIRDRDYTQKSLSLSLPPPVSLSASLALALALSRYLLSLSPPSLPPLPASVPLLSLSFSLVSGKRGSWSI